MQVAPTWPVAPYSMGVLAEEQKNTQSAEQWYRKALAIDPYPYGVKSNQKVLETVAEYSHEQGLSKRLLKPEELFASETLESFKI